MYRSFASATASASSRAFLDVDTLVAGQTQDLATAFNTSNYDQWAALFAPAGQLMPPGREAVQGAKAIEQVIRSLGESGYRDLRFETLRVDHSGDIAVEMGRYTAALSLENGTTTPERGKYLRVWQRLGTWLIVADCWNTNVAAQ
jgi:ketosteroid isomerase-like protein